MATLICNNSGNLTGASTFAAAEIGTGALNLVRFSHNSGTAAAGTITSVAFTVTSGKVIDGVVLWLKQANQAATNGTVKVALNKGGVEQASVTVNKTDMPVNPTNTSTLPNHPVFFKFTSTATGDGAANWTIVLTTTGTGDGIYYSITASGATNLTRVLRTTTPATAVANDDFYIVGELTGQGTHTSRTVTMDSTAAVVYGSGLVGSTTVNGGACHISCWGSLVYGTAAGTNYILRMAGSIGVYFNSAFSIGAPGAEIPRTSTAVLEFQLPTADGDYGLYCGDYSTVNFAGLSRTAGKNVVKCKLTADVVSSNVINNSGLTNTSGAAGGPDAGGSLFGGSIVDNATNATHGVWLSGPASINVTQTVTVWITRGSGLNNRYVRLTLGNSTVQTSVSSGLYTDIDLLLGTASGPTAVGTGTAISVSITPEGIGYVVKLTGKVSTISATPSAIINSCAVAGTMTYAGNTTQCFSYDRVAIINASSVPDTVFSVDTDTGWLAGDVIGVSSTSRTSSDSGSYPLNAPASATSLTSAIYTCAAWGGQMNIIYSGTAPTQAEVINLTRNVKVRSTSQTLMAFFQVLPMATVTASWTEFQRFGVNVTGRRGIEFEGGSVANPKSFSYCSLRDFEYMGFYLTPSYAVSMNVNLSNNTLWNVLGTSFSVTNVLSAADWVFDNNVLMRCQTGFNLADVGGTCTNNTVCSSNVGTSYILDEGSVGGTLCSIGFFDGNTAHSNTGTALLLGKTQLIGTVSNYTAWRNGSYGVAYGQHVMHVVLNNITLFGNGTANIEMIYGGKCTITGTNIVCGDTSHATTTGIRLDYGCTHINMDNVDMVGSTIPFTVHSANDFLLRDLAEAYVLANNCKFGAASLINPRSYLAAGGYFGFQNFNRAPGEHRTELRHGQLSLDSATFRSAAPSLRMVPNSINKLESATLGRGIQVTVAAGEVLAVSVWVRMDVLYNGSQPRLIVRANPSVGVISNTVLGTCTGSTGVWSQISGTTFAPITAGMLEFIVDCDGTAGFVHVDDWRFEGERTTVNDLTYWFNGLPMSGSSGAAGGGESFFGGFVG